MNKNLKELYKERYDVLDTLLTESLINKGMIKTLSAMQEAKRYHNGLRKNKAPEFIHQIEICINLLTVLNIKDKQRLDNILTTSILHDLQEDYNISTNDINKKYGADVADWVNRLTKVFPDGSKKTNEDYFEDIAKSPEALIIKVADRCHNVHSMKFGFKKEKQIEYIEETNKFFTKLINDGLVKYPEFEFVLCLFSSSIFSTCKEISLEHMGLNGGGNIPTNIKH